MFSDCEGNSISFFNSDNEKETIAQSTQTDNKIKSYTDKEIQIVERTDSCSQTNLKETLSRQTLNLDEKKLEIFLKKAIISIDDALLSREDDNFEIYDDVETEDCSSSIIMRLPLIDNKSQPNTKISDLCWNSSGNLLAFSYFVENHYGPCSHSGYINILKFGNISQSKNYNEKIQIETNSCIKCIDSHPKNPSLFVCGSYTGEICLIDMSNENGDYIQYISRVDSYFHKDCVISVKWTKTEWEGKHYILSLSEEGRLLIWNPENKLAFPLIGFSLKFKILKNIYSINPTIIAENPYDPFSFIIGTVDGNIYKCGFNKPTDNNFDYILQNSGGIVWRSAVKNLLSNMNDKEVIELKNYVEMLCKDKIIVDLNPEEFFKLKPDINKLYKNALKSNYEKHISVVTGVEFNYFIKNLFLTCSFDGSLRIYHQNYHGSKYLISNHLNDEYYTAAVWSPFKADIVISGTSNGKISFHKLVGKSLRLLHEISRKTENSLVAYPVNKIASNNLIKNIIAVCYEDGMLDIIKLSDDLCVDKYDDISRFNKLVNSIIT